MSDGRSGRHRDSDAVMDPLVHHELGLARWAVTQVFRHQLPSLGVDAAVEHRLDELVGFAAGQLAGATAQARGRRQRVQIGQRLPAR